MCCDETGIPGLVFLIVCIFLGMGYAIFSLISGAFVFAQKRHTAWRWRYVEPVALVAFAFLAAGGVSGAAFFEMEIIAGYVGFALLFLAATAIFLIVTAVVYVHAMKERSLFDINLLLCVISPIVQGGAVCCIALLLIEDRIIGDTALKVIIGICVAICFLYGLSVMAFAGGVVVRGKKRQAYIPWFVVAAIILSGAIIIGGSTAGAFFALSTFAGGIGLLIVAIIQIVFQFIMFWLYYRVQGNIIDYQQKWTMMGVVAINSIFLAVTVVGLLSLLALFLVEEY